MPEIGEAGQKGVTGKGPNLGAGGLGTPVIAGLAGAGVGHLTLMDDDVVELTNLNRQITHTMDRLGTNKAESAAVFAHELNPDISFRSNHRDSNQKMQAIWSRLAIWWLIVQIMPKHVIL